MVGPAQGGRGLTLGGAQQRIARINGKSREESQPPSVAAERRAVRKQEIQQIFQIVCPGNREAQLLQQRFQVLLGGLLAMETDLIRQGLASRGEFAGCSKVVFRFADPLASHPFHTEFSPYA